MSHSVLGNIYPDLKTSPKKPYPYTKLIPTTNPKETPPTPEIDAPLFASISNGLPPPVIPFPLLVNAAPDVFGFVADVVLSMGAEEDMDGGAWVVVMVADMSVFVFVRED